MSLGQSSLGLASLGLSGKLQQASYGFPLLRYLPNTSSFIVERFTFKTSITESFSGKEQRQGLRNKPVTHLLFNGVTAGDDARSSYAFMQSATELNLAIPMWQDQTVLAQKLSSANVVIKCDAATRAFEVGYFCLVATPDLSLYEFSPLVQVADDELQAGQPFVYEWPAGSIVVPVAFGQVMQDYQHRWFKGATATTDFTCQVDVSTSPDSLKSADQYDTFNGVEVLSEIPTWRSSPEERFETGLVVAQSDSALFETFNPKGKNRSRLRFEWALDTRQKIESFKAFVARRKGRLHAFYYARPMRDFTIVQAIVSGANQLLVKGNDYANYLFAKPHARALAIHTYQGNHYHNIGAAQVQGNNTLLTLSDPVQADIQLHQIRYCSLLVYGRLDADQVEIPYFTHDAATPTTYFKEVLQ